jgi:ABC-type uncharacterized transport system substrate-binding protein
MRRREFITLLGGAAASWPYCSRAELTSKVFRVGFMVTGSLQSPEQRSITDAFRQGLRERGYLEGQNIVIEYRAAAGKIERFTELAAELVDLHPDLIVASNTPAARAARQATTTIPIVVAVMGDPVSDGLVASLARPAGNVTGMTFLGPELASKRLELLKQALPAMSRIAALWHPGAYGESTMTEMMGKMETAAATLLVRLQPVEVRPSSTAHSWRWLESAPTPSSYCRARCFLANEDTSLISPHRTGCLRLQWPESSWSLVA